MNAKNCARCGKLFSHLVGLPLCPECREQDEQDYKKIKEYLYDNRGATMSEVSEKLEISLSKIKRFLKEGRIEIMEGSNFILECERCGASIQSGQYCNYCIKELSDNLKAETGKAMNRGIDNSDGYKKTEKMRYLNKDRIK